MQVSECSEFPVALVLGSSFLCVLRASVVGFAFVFVPLRAPSLQLPRLALLRARLGYSEMWYR